MYEDIWPETLSGPTWATAERGGILLEAGIVNEREGGVLTYGER